MASESEIRGAERARLEGIVAEFGTERERLEVLLDGVMRNGFTQGQYLGEEPLGRLPAGIELLGRLARRVERRGRANLPAVECGGDPPTHGCRCLDRALDECDVGGRRAVLKMAAGFHWSPPPRAREKAPAPQEVVTGPQETNGRVEDPSPQPKPAPKAEPPFRVVKHFPRWYDPEPQSFRDMRF
jgi:hypothetical protein